MQLVINGTEDPEKGILSFEKCRPPSLCERDHTIFRGLFLIFCIILIPFLS